MTRRLRREGALQGTGERNQLAAKLKAKREGNHANWTEEEVAEMEAGDTAYAEWWDEFEALKALVGP